MHSPLQIFSLKLCSATIDLKNIEQCLIFADVKVFQGKTGNFSTTSDLANMSSLPTGCCAVHYTLRSGLDVYNETS